MRALLVALALLVSTAPALAGQKPPPRRLGAAYAAKRAAQRPPPPVVVVKSRAQSAGMSCRSTARG
ncbi:MAG TPA: hypothetical protein VFU21_01560 [Kofleriaceae bacterium]|nr:hypothetical protein [Kofleriaceae bacterium]